jgi:Flp pilus assembly pilin Flp
MFRFLRRLFSSASGGPATEYALLLMLVAAVAGFGMIVLGDSLSQFYSNAGEAVSTEIAMPSQDLSSTVPRCVEVDSNCRAGR